MAASMSAPGELSLSEAQRRALALLARAPDGIIEDALVLAHGFAPWSACLVDAGLATAQREIVDGDWPQDEPSSNLIRCDSVRSTLVKPECRDNIARPSSGPGVQSEALVFLSFFADLPDPRQAGKVIYPLQEVLLLCLLAVLAGAESFVEIARFVEKKIELLRRFLPFKDGTPSHDQLRDIFAMIDATRFERCIHATIANLTKSHSSGWGLRCFETGGLRCS
jgi:hypothetical protein